MMIADRAYTLLNGVTIRGDISLQLKINSPSGDNPEPEAHAGILHIKNLPCNTNNKSLYELFRPFGPMILCKILLDQSSTFKGAALVQYFHSEHAQHAQDAMVK
jgi:polyadenylate-binding protein